MTLTETDAFDVIGELTFSKPLGFLEHGHDVDGIIGSLEKMLDYAGKVNIIAPRDQASAHKIDWPNALARLPVHQEPIQTVGVWRIYWGRRALCSGSHE